MPGRAIICVVGLFVTAPAFSTEVPGISCSQIGSFARQVTKQKADGVGLDIAVRRLRQSFGPDHPDTERELEKIVQAIYRVPVFSTATPEEVGSAYRQACEMGQ